MGPICDVLTLARDKRGSTHLALTLTPSYGTSSLPGSTETRRSNAETMRARLGRSLC
jgi:hypothetical protein